MSKKIFPFAELMLFINALIWGGTFVLIKESLQNISPMLFLTIRFSIASFLFLPFAISSFKYLNSISYKEGSILGLLLFIGFATQTVGLKFTTVTKSAFITGTYVIITPILQTLIEKRIPSIQNILGTILVFIGIILLSSSGTTFNEFINELGSNLNIGDFLTLLCAFFYSLYIIYLDIISPRHNIQYLTFTQIFITAILGLITTFIFSSLKIESVELITNNIVIISLIYTALLATLVTTFIQTKYQREVTPTKAGIIFSFEPVFAAFTAFIFLNETFTFFGILGCIFIFSGLLITELWNQKNK